jgi:hypothetical protein
MLIVPSDAILAETIEITRPGREKAASEDSA